MISSIKGDSFTNYAGQDPTEILIMIPKPYGFSKILSALIHVIIHIRIQYYKQKDTRKKNLYLQDIEAR